MESRRWYLVFIPLFAVLGFVVVYPLIASLYISLTTVSGSFSLSNYAAMVSTPTFWNALNISLLYSLSSTIIAVAIGLGLTYILTQELRGRGFFEMVYILPLAVAPIVVGTVWAPSGFWDDVQTFSHFQLHLPYFNELSPLFYFPTMFLSEAWEWEPLIMLVAISIINGTAKEIYEAAELHGATAFQKFRMVTLPSVLRSPVMQVIVVLRFIDAMRAFEIPLAWSNWLGYTTTLGSPVDTISLYIYKLLFSSPLGFSVGVASAVALTLFAITLVGALILLRILKAVGD
ncbi:MAG TPA: sugar ABC transporter permease [Nitrososphaerales archaeon]|nr:sugar ABC transporter permease [Nitrososphaerales archaeon]